jgi:hypothetical protein
MRFTHCDAVSSELARTASSVSTFAAQDDSDDMSHHVCNLRRPLKWRNITVNLSIKNALSTQRQ